MLQDPLLEGRIVWTPSILMEGPSTSNLQENPSIVQPLHPDTSPLETVLFVPKTTYFRPPGHRMYEVSVRNSPL